MKREMSLRRPAPRRKKKLPTRHFLSAYILAMVCAIADFPDPADPLSQHIGRSPPPSMHRTMSAMTALRVPSRHWGTQSRRLYGESRTGSSVCRIWGSEVGRSQSVELYLIRNGV